MLQHRARSVDTAGALGPGIPITKSRAVSCAMTIPSAASARGVAAKRGEAMETKLTQLGPVEPRRGPRRARASVVIAGIIFVVVST